MLTPEEKDEREGKLGSSDAPVVAGVSPYKSPLTLYYQLHGELPRYDEDETEAQLWGSKLEPVIAEVAAEKLGVKIRRSPVRILAAKPFMAAHLDYEIVSHANGPGVLEVKNRGGKPFDNLPDDITLQVAHQLAVTEREWGIVAVLFGYGKLKTFEVERDRELEEYLIELEARFMVRVHRGEPPDVQWDTQTVGLLKKLYPTDSGKVIELGEDAAVQVQAFLAAKAELDQAAEHKAAAEGWLKAVMQDASTAKGQGYEITWKASKGRTTFDAERFQAEHPDLWAAYQRTMPGSRRFLVKAKGLMRL